MTPMVIAQSAWQDVAIEFRRILEHPARADPEGTFNAVLDLVKRPEFQAARLALYQAEAFAAAGQHTPEELSAHLDTAVTHYNEIVAAHAGATRRRAIHHVLPFVAGQAMQLTNLPGAAAAGAGQLRRLPAG